MELHEWFADESRATLLRSSGLRVGDLELLAMERRGLVTKEIARTMGVSVDSVNSQFQRIEARLECPTRKAAARRAAEYGLI
jgi:DNA-binding CsgD family transcriptional regulator